MQVSKNLERIADHAKGIAEYGYYMVPANVCGIKLVT